MWPDVFCCVRHGKWRQAIAIRLQFHSMLSDVVLMMMVRVQAVQAPRFGTLHQQQGSLGRVGATVPVRQAMMTLGRENPAQFFSSHNSSCDSMCCYPQGHLQHVAESGRWQFCSGSCSDCPQSMFMLAGEPDAPPGKRGTPGALAASWVPGCVDCGWQWVWLKVVLPGGCPLNSSPTYSLVALS